MTFPTATTPTLSSSEVFPPNISSAFTTFATAVVADLVTLGGVTPEAALAPFTCRGVALTVSAYAGTGTGTLTASANGTLASTINVDGLTIAATDCIFLPPGLTNLTAVDSGPWTVVSLGAAGAKWQLKRPAWWAHAFKWTSGQIIHIGGEGTIYRNTEWKATAAAALVDATDPAFYVGRLIFQIKLVAGTQILNAAQPSVAANYPLTGSTAGQHSFPAGILSATTSSVSFELAIPAGTLTGTVGYGGANASSSAPCTAGYVGTAAATAFALATAQATQTSDISTLQCTLINW